MGKPGECESCTEVASESAGACSWASKCINSEGACQACNASPFAGDNRCVCGPGSADWIKPGECKSCTEVATESAGACSWASKCINSEGACQACNASPFAGDSRCVCGPGSADWIKPGECKSCTEVATESAGACSWASKCINSEGACQACN